MYIPQSKIILLCSCILIFCTILLLITWAIDSSSQKKIDKAFLQKAQEKQTVTKEEKIQPAVKEEKKTSQKVPLEPKNKEISKVEEKKESKNQKESSQKKESPEKAEKTAPKTGEIKTPSKESIAQTLDFNFPPAENGANLIFVFDDGGHNTSQLEKFLKIPFPITIAVLPRLPASKECADLVRKSGNELILHQPMQAVNLNTDPGAGAIKPDMDEDLIRSVLFENLLEVGPITGINNHEGSLITADSEKMSVILKFLSDEGLYFLDSRTNSQTQVPYVAKALGYSYYQRNIFLDNKKTRENFLSELKQGLEIANKQGNVIMIGHVWSADLIPALLIETYPELVKKGYKFSTVSSSSALISPF